MTKKFLRDNPIKYFSTQRLISSIISYKGIEDYANEFVLENVDLGVERFDRIRNEKELIKNEQDPDELINFLRKNFELVNRVDLVNRVLEFESELMPKVIEKLIRSDNEIFIENAIRLLAKSEQDYSQQLHRKYNQIRRPYAQSMVCVILGFRGNEEIIPWMMNQYTEMKRLYPEETYDQGPLLALHNLYQRIYEKTIELPKKKDIQIGRASCRETV